MGQTIIWRSGISWSLHLELFIPFQPVMVNVIFFWQISSIILNLTVFQQFRQHSLQLHWSTGTHSLKFMIHVPNWFPPVQKSFSAKTGSVRLRCFISLFSFFCWLGAHCLTKVQSSMIYLLTRKDIIPKHFHLYVNTSISITQKIYALIQRHPWRDFPSIIFFGFSNNLQAIPSTIM